MPGASGRYAGWLRNEAHSHRHAIVDTRSETPARLLATPMSTRAQRDERITARLAELQPLTGDFGRPEDVAAACVYLATAPFVTGAVLTVDGGWTAR